MTTRKSILNNCLDCENYKRKVKENERTVSSRDVLIEMLQTELKKKENLYKNAIDEHEKLRFLHCSVVQDYTNLKEIHKKLIEENKKLYEEKKLFLVKISKNESSAKSSRDIVDESGEPREATNIKNVSDGITNLQNIMQCQNKSLRSVLGQLLDEMKKSRMDKSPDREIQNFENKDSSVSADYLTKQITDLNSFIEKLQKENKKFKHNLYEKQVSLSNCLAILETNNADIDNLSEHVEGLCRERDKYREEVTSLGSELVEKESEITKLKLENRQIDDLKSENSKLSQDNCCHKSRIDTYMLESEKLKKEIEEKNEFEKKAAEYQSLYQHLQIELDVKLKDYSEYRKNVSVTIEQLQGELEAAKVQQEPRGIQCDLNCPEVRNTSTQESPSMKNRNSQSSEECLAICNEKTQVDELELSICSGKETIDIEDHNEELQALETKFAECKSLLDNKITFLEKSNRELKENLSILSSGYENNIKKIEEEHEECKFDLENQIRTLESDNLSLKKTKNKIAELEMENKGLKETLNNLTHENEDNLKKLEENYSICKTAIENKIKHIEDDNKHLRETLGIVYGDKDPDTDDEFAACKCVLENKIRALEKENKNLKDILNITTDDYEFKLRTLEEEFSKNKINLESQIKFLEDDKANLTRKLALSEKKEFEHQKSEEDFQTSKCVLEHKIKVLESENKLLASVENKKLRNEVESNSLEIQDIANQTDEFTEETTELKKEINELQNKILALQLELENANLEITEYEEENRSYSQKSQALMNEITGLHEAKIRADEEINDYNDRLNEMRDEFDKLNQQRLEMLTELTGQINELEDKLIEFDCNVNKIKVLEEKIKELEVTVEDSSKQTDHLRKVISELEKQIEDINLQKIEMIHQELLHQLNNYQNQLEEKQTIIQNLEKCIDKSNDILERCEKEMKVVQQENDELRDELEKKIKALENMQEKNACLILQEKSLQLFKENQSIKEQFKNNQQHINTQISQLRSEYNRLLKESKSKDRQLEIIKQQLKQISAKDETPAKSDKIATIEKSKLCELKSILKHQPKHDLRASVKKVFKPGESSYITARNRKPSNTSFKKETARPINKSNELRRQTSAILPSGSNTRKPISSLKNSSFSGRTVGGVNSETDKKSKISNLYIKNNKTSKDGSDAGRTVPKTVLRNKTKDVSVYLALGKPSINKTEVQASLVSGDGDQLGIEKSCLSIDDEKSIQPPLDPSCTLVSIRKSSNTVNITKDTGSDSIQEVQAKQSEKHVMKSDSDALQQLGVSRGTSTAILSNYLDKKLIDTKKSAHRQETGSDPIQELQQKKQQAVQINNTCNCMSVILKQYESYNAKVQTNITQNIDSCEIYDTLSEEQSFPKAILTDSNLSFLSESDAFVKESSEEFSTTNSASSFMKKRLCPCNHPYEECSEKSFFYRGDQSFLLYKYDGNANSSTDTSCTDTFS